MVSKLAPWVWVGAALLAMIAGMVNAVGFLSFQHQGVTHLTGTTTLAGVALVDPSAGRFSHVVAVIAAFVGGCIASGFIIGDSTLKLGRRYGAALMLEAALLCAAVPFLQQDEALGAYLASCACGLQNGMVSTYSGAVLRTTHLSGIFTDLGIFAGHALRGLAVDRRRAALGLLIIGGFFAGAVAATLSFRSFHYGTLYFPALLTGAVGAAYTLYRYVRVPKA